MNCLQKQLAVCAVTVRLQVKMVLLLQKNLALRLLSTTLNSRHSLPFHRCHVVLDSVHNFRCFPEQTSDTCHLHNKLIIQIVEGISLNYTYTYPPAFYSITLLIPDVWPSSQSLWVDLKGGTVIILGSAKFETVTFIVLAYPEELK